MSRRIRVKEVADNVIISIGPCHDIFSYVLGMKIMAKNAVPKTIEFCTKTTGNGKQGEALQLTQTGKARLMGQNLKVTPDVFLDFTGKKRQDL